MFQIVACYFLYGYKLHCKGVYSYQQRFIYSWLLLVCVFWLCMPYYFLSCCKKRVTFDCFSNTLRLFCFPKDSSAQKQLCCLNKTQSATLGEVLLCFFFFYTLHFYLFAFNDGPLSHTLHKQIVLKKISMKGCLWSSRNKGFPFLLIMDSLTGKVQLTLLTIIFLLLDPTKDMTKLAMLDRTFRIRISVSVFSFC